MSDKNPKKFRVLVLDDDITRHHEFEKRFTEENNCVLDQVFRADSCIETIKQNGLEKYDIICLDHDLNEEDNQFYCFGKGTGTEVASYIAGQYDAKKHARIYVIIHSTNSVGAANMFNILDSCGIATILRPMLWLKQVFDNTLYLRQDYEN